MKSSSQFENRLLLLILLIIETAHLFYLILNHRMPVGHDGFFYFSMQYFFLNDVVTNHEIPLWVPYLNHGITATWWYIIQGCFCPLADALLLIGRMFMSINFLDLFHCGIFVDRLLLLSGVWLLGQRYFRSPFTLFFVTSCVLSSTVTMTQFYFTLHLYYAIPLLLYLGHVFLDTGRWRYFFLACNLFMIQMIGNAAYFLPIISLTIFLYFLFYALDQPSQFQKHIKNLHWGSSSLVGITCGLLSMAILAMVLLAGKDPAWINLDFERNIDSSSSLNVFLTYAGNMNFNKWQEMFLRLSPSLDFTIYMGLLAVPLVFFGLIFNRNRYKYPLLLVSLILLFFSMGTWVSVFFYYVWPAMKFYRHLSLIVPIIKLLLIFLAGFGFESVFVNRKDWQGQKNISFACFFTAGIFLIVFIILSQMSSNGILSSHYIIRTMTVQTSQTPTTFDPLIVSQRLGEASLYALLLAFLFLLLPLDFCKQNARAFLLAAILINTSDIYGYYCTEINARTFSLNKEQYRITAFSPMPYAPRRLVNQPNPRANILLSPIAHLTIYSTINAFLFQDALATPYRTDGRLKPLNDLVTAFGPQVLSNPAFLKVAGSSEDKIQFFSHACAASDQQAASLISNPLYQGDNLLVSAQTPVLPECSPQEVLHSNDRLNIPYHIDKFTPNTLELSATINSKAPIWMMYSDVWHKGWQAKVNGRQSEVLKADLAYKAIKLLPGPNKIKFSFTAPKIAFLQKIIALNALFWVALILYLILEILGWAPQVFLIKQVK